MAGYIGARASVVSSGAERKQTYAITTTTTSLTGLAYTPTKVHVYHNGIRLVDGTDYTATDGSSITLTTAAQSGDEVVVISYATFQTSDTVSAANGGTFAGNVTHTGTLTASGAFTSLGIDDNATSTAMTLDSSGNVGIGTSSPTADGLQIVEATQPDFFMGNTADPDGFRITYNSTDTSIGTHSNTPLRIRTNGSERARFDASGNFCVGTTGVDPHNASQDAGVALRSDGRIHIGVDGDTPLHVNRNTSDGDIIRLRKGGTTLGTMGCASGSLVFYIAGKENAVKLVGPVGTGVDALGPSNTSGSNRDNQMDLGWSSNRFDDVYATNGTIQTSDQNEKQDIAELDEAEKRVATAAKGLIRKYRWIDAVQEKGDDARIHVGIIAQDLQAAFEAEGLDASRYAMFISSTWWEADETYTDDDGVEQTRTNTYETQEEAPEGATERTRLGVRYPELLAFIIGAL